MLASLPGFDVDRGRIEVAEVDAVAALLRDPRGEDDVDARLLDAVAERADALHVRRMRQHAARILLELVHPRPEIVAHVIADLVEHLAVRVGDLGDVRRVDDQFRAVGQRRSSLYMHLPAVQMSSYISGAQESTR